MSAAAAAASSAKDAPADEATVTGSAGRGKKKLIIIAAAALAVLLAGGAGAAFYLMKKRAAAAAAVEAGEEAGADTKEDAKAAEEQVKADLKHAPTFVPLEPFTVNLADREAERYAQVGMTLELADPKAADLLKAYMPAIRNNILLVLASKTAAQMMDHDGKLQLAGEIRAAALKPLGYDSKATAKQGAADEEVPPVKAVHFSNFIIQ
jgi:flagellar protein FliL